MRSPLLRFHRHVTNAALVLLVVAVSLAHAVEVTTVVGPQNGEASPLKSPFGVDFNADGDMFIVELYGGRVHRLSKQGELVHIAGDGSKSYHGDGGPAAKGTFNGMHNVAVTPQGDVLISDSWNHVVRKIDGKSGQISTLYGTGEPGYSGDGGPADKARFNYIMCITLNAAGDVLYLADLKNRRIRRVDMKSGVVTTIAGNGRRGVPTDGDLATESPLVDPRAVASDSKGNVYILERGGHALRVIGADGKIHTVAGTGKAGFKDGPALQAQLNSPKHLCVDAKDRVIIADDTNAAIRVYDPATKEISTILGRGFGDPKIKLKKPHGVTVENGVLYVVDSENHRILKVE